LKYIKEEIINERYMSDSICLLFSNKDLICTAMMKKVQKAISRKNFFFLKKNFALYGFLYTDNGYFLSNQIEIIGKMIYKSLGD